MSSHYVVGADKFQEFVPTAKIKTSTVLQSHTDVRIANCMKSQCRRALAYVWRKMRLF